MALPEKIIDELSKDKVDVPGWSWRIFLFSLFVLILSLAFYAGLNWGYKTYLNNRIKNLDSEISQIKKQSQELNEDQLTVFYSQLANIKKLFSERKSFIKIVDFLEKNVHKNVTLTKVNFVATSNQINLNGNSKSKDAILEQILLFQKNENVENVVLKGFSNQGENWNFGLDIYLRSSFWKEN
jgi:hypothetical protein